MANKNIETSHSSTDLLFSEINIERDAKAIKQAQWCFHPQVEMKTCTSSIYRPPPSNIRIIFSQGISKNHNAP